MDYRRGDKMSFEFNDVEITSPKHEASRSFDPDKAVDQLSAEKPEHFKCINEDLAGKTHPETGVPFERKTVEVDGKLKEVVVPEFESNFDTKLPEELYRSSDKVQFQYCNEQLKNAVENDPELKEKFDDEQLEQISDGYIPDGFTWHHDAEVGCMQLVDTKTHQITHHTGGKAIWGGGKECR